MKKTAIAVLALLLQTLLLSACALSPGLQRNLPAAEETESSDQPLPEEAESEEIQAGGREIAGQDDIEYKEYMLDGGALIFSIPGTWDEETGSEEKLSFRNGQAVFEAERVESPGERVTLNSIIDTKLSEWAENAFELDSEIVKVDSRYDGIISAVTQVLGGDRTQTVYILSVLAKDRAYVISYRTESSFLNEDYDGFRQIISAMTLDDSILSSQAERDEELLTDSEESPKQEPLHLEDEDKEFDITGIPAFAESPWIEVNGGHPYFTEEDRMTDVYQHFSEMDSLGRCGLASACLGPETMPAESRGSIGMIRPSGWHISRYRDIDGSYLYNRCHLIGYQLSGQNANEQNLITGTRFMNIQGMEPFERRTAEYMESTGHHVLYRVTPVFLGEELVARGVLMEAASVEDDALEFCVFCYNVQPGVEIDYKDGSNTGEGKFGEGE